MECICCGWQRSLFDREMTSRAPDMDMVVFEGYFKTKNENYICLYIKQFRRYFVKASIYICYILVQYDHLYINMCIQIVKLRIMN